MNFARRAQNVLRSVKQRWGTSNAKHRLWDNEYAGGRWNHCEQTPGAVVYRYIEKYCANGSILDLGCGSGNTGNELDPTKYHRYIGVDISEIATQKATSRSQHNGRGETNQYLQGDIVSFEPDATYDVICFRESIYYIPHSKIKSMLDRYACFLKENGVFVVNVSKYGTRKGQQILELIESNFEMLEKYAPSEGEEFVTIFRPSHR